MDEIPRPQFLLLVERTWRQLDNDIERGQIIFWQQAPMDHPAREARMPRIFIGIDSVLIALADLFEKNDVKRKGITRALPGMQLVLPNGVDRPGTKMMISIMRDRKTLGVGCGTEEELRDIGLFVGKDYAISWRLPVANAVALVRERAGKHKVKLPECFAPSEPPLQVRGVAPSWKFRSADGRTMSTWKPTHRFVQIEARPNV
jgi:hypothetical protein